MRNKDQQKNSTEMSKKDQAAHDRELREANHVEHAFHFEVHGVKQVRVALHFIPVFQKIILGCFLISALLAGMSVWEYFNRNPAMLFLSMPDGSLRCPLKTFNIETKKLYERPEEYEAFCRQFQGTNAVLSEQPEHSEPKPTPIGQSLQEKNNPSVGAGSGFSEESSGASVESTVVNDSGVENGLPNQQRNGLEVGPGQAPSVQGSPGGSVVDSVLPVSSQPVSSQPVSSKPVSSKPVSSKPVSSQELGWWSGRGAHKTGDRLRFGGVSVGWLQGEIYGTV